MDYRIERRDGLCRVLIASDLSFREAAAFRGMAEEVAAAATPVEIDLSAVRFIDSAGLGMLLILRDLIPMPVRLRVSDGQVGRVIQMASFTDFFSIQEEPGEEEPR